MSNIVDQVLMAEDDGATFLRAIDCRWFAHDKDGAVIVRDAESLAEAARLYCEDKGLPKAKPAMPDEVLAGIVAEYAPYDAMPEFQHGFDAHAARQWRNPYGDSAAGQAWDRGLEAAARYVRALDAAQRGAVVEAARRPGKAVR